MDEAHESLTLSQSDKINVTEDLFNKYGTEIKRIAYLYVREHSLAEDILQEVFIACFHNLDKFRGESSYKTWLIKITANKCKDVLKRWSFRNILYKNTINEASSYKDTPESILLSKQEEYEVARQLLTLPIKLREVIILHYYQELSIEEISHILTIKPNTIKSRLHRGRKQL
ncbi:sigma-70 family RNA polymerase sigma factor [Sutcliffiella halmapala]|uniref:sigma-70 family RNA polymerase sigma factor n=1 Tax=Sutcliffiella halmapala TaxID=79882 RepID=UPI000995D523|nr:sigma-70 family RNA polymerase sigma factor [Sutcliffiella halmapala]